MEDGQALKLCPLCAEEIRPAATRCRYCHSDIGNPSAGEITSRWVRAHPTLMLSLATFLYVTFEVYKAGDFEVNNTVELLRASGLTTILTGVLLQQLSIVLFLLCLAICWWLVSLTLTTTSPKRQRTIWLTTDDPRTSPQVLLIALLAISFYIIPWPLFLVIITISAFATVISRRHRVGSYQGAVRLRRTVVVVSAIFAIYLGARPTIWVPSESVTTTDNGTIVAYVISDDGQWTTLLTPKWTRRLPPGQNSLIRERSDNIVGRKLCAMDLLEAQLFGRVLRLRPVQIADVIERHALPAPLTPACP